jgi:subtilisin family serine protease
MHAVEYLFELGNARNQPVSINISLGTNGHAHDASSVNSRWIDFALSSAGRNICVAAGNAGQIEPAEPGDWGFVMGRVHTSGVLKPGQSVEIEWIVLGDGIADLSENELEIWYEPQDLIEIEIRPPGSSECIGPVKPGQFQQNRMLSDGTFISIYNEIYSAANGHNYIACYLSPLLSSEKVVGVRAGTWLVKLTASDIRSGRYHAWIERDDPRRLGKTGFKEAWAFPSFFSRDSTVGDSTVSSLACGQRVVSVANFDQVRKSISITSSRGPTRDERLKPDIAAPGTDIVAASGFGDPDQPWIMMSGTSMASPYVAGVVARMLILEPKLTASQIGGIIRRTAKPLAGAVDFGWENDAGFGEIDPVSCMEEVVELRTREDLG